MCLQYSASVLSSFIQRMLSLAFLCFCPLLIIGCRPMNCSSSRLSGDASISCDSCCLCSRIFLCRRPNLRYSMILPSLSKKVASCASCGDSARRGLVLLWMSLCMIPRYILVVPSTILPTTSAFLFCDCRRARIKRPSASTVTLVVGSSGEETSNGAITEGVASLIITSAIAHYLVVCLVINEESSNDSKSWFQRMGLRYEALLPQAHYACKYARIM